LIFINLSDKLRRSTNSSYFIPEIDGLRFYAIITVVIFHLNTAFSRQIGLTDLGISLLGGKESLTSPAWWIIRLDLGVKVFFAISGMVLALPFLKQKFISGPKLSLGDYFYRRLTRLEPPFVISLILFFCVHTLILNEQVVEMLPHFFTGLMYAHVFVYGFPNPINPVTWSLETEAQFYLLVPFLFAIIFRFNSLIWSIFIIITGFILSVILKFIFTEYNINELNSSIFAYFSNFAVGIIFAWIYLKNIEFFQKKDLLWDIVGLLAIFSQFFFYKPQHDFLNNILFNLSILTMMFSTFKGRIMNWFFTRPVIFIVGGMCYSIYLLHFAFFHLLVMFTSSIVSGMGYGIDLLIQIIIALPIVLLVSALFYLLIEKPCMDKLWPRRLLNKLQKVMS
jgi:peptidoglycan/LPS O-acetylase OafA/YrhL